MTSLQQLLAKNRPLVMGIVNTTPDSFFDGGKYNVTASAVEHALQMIEHGADMIDVGGESTRPGAAAVALDDELERVIPVIAALRKQSAVFISVDTSKPDVMRAAMAAGANMINDVQALQAPTAIEVCAQLKTAVCLMHMQGEPRSMQNNPQYHDVVTEVKTFLQQRVTACVHAGMAADNIVIDPGFGFGKSLQHNLVLLKRLNELTGLQQPILVGLSRKSMYGKLLNVEVQDRLPASLASAVLAYTNGARIFRVHDVKPTVDVLRVSHAAATISDNV